MVKIRLGDRAKLINVGSLCPNVHLVRAIEAFRSCGRKYSRKTLIATTREWKVTMIKTVAWRGLPIRAMQRVEKAQSAVWRSAKLKSLHLICMQSKKKWGGRCKCSSISNSSLISRDTWWNRTASDSLSSEMKCRNNVSKLVCLSPFRKGNRSYQESFLTNRCKVSIWNHYIRVA